MVVEILMWRVNGLGFMVRNSWFVVHGHGAWLERFRSNKVDFLTRVLAEGFHYLPYASTLHFIPFAI